MVEILIYSPFRVTCSCAYAVAPDGRRCGGVHMVGQASQFEANVGMASVQTSVKSGWHYTRGWVNRVDIRYERIPVAVWDMIRLLDLLLTELTHCPYHRDPIPSLESHRPYMQIRHAPALNASTTTTLDSIPISRITLECSLYTTLHILVITD